MQRRIAHLDMDAFYASVELLRYPQLRGVPVVVGGRRAAASEQQAESVTFRRLQDYAGRGVVTTATYEARAFGVHSGMGLMKAARLAPDAILLPADFDQYRYYSQCFKAAVAGLAPCIEDRGIDEIYIDLSAVAGTSTELGQELKARVRNATGLSCSIGITPNKLLSKLASELQKPDGLTILDYPDIPDRIWPLPAQSINGIGPKAAARLTAMGIHTIGDLAAVDLDLLTAQFGVRYGHWLRQVARGQDDRPVVMEREPKSISRETTFERDLHPRQDRPLLTQLLLDLCVRLSGDLHRKGYLGKTIGIKLRYADFKTVTRDTTLNSPTADAEVIRQAARTCLQRVDLQQRLRLLGVRVGALSRTETTAGETHGTA